VIPVKLSLYVDKISTHEKAKARSFQNIIALISLIDRIVYNEKYKFFPNFRHIVFNCLCISSVFCDLVHEHGGVFFILTVAELSTINQSSGPTLVCGILEKT
jgi:hypothetical protein